jgi:Raf kinase inhibitor-like YbhB/YbcL family protein
VTRIAPALALLLTLAVPGCGGDGDKPPPALSKLPAEIALQSAGFPAGGEIPARFTCEGDGSSPPLSWNNVPAGTAELAIVVDDPDAPGGAFTHWTVWALPPENGGFAEGVVPPTVLEGDNSQGERGWTGPCPPEGDDPHRYVFTIYALKTRSGLDAGDDPDVVRARLAEIATARGSYTGTFGR